MTSETNSLQKSGIIFCPNCENLLRPIPIRKKNGRIVLTCIFGCSEILLKIVKTTEKVKAF